MVHRRGGETGQGHGMAAYHGSVQRSALTIAGRGAVFHLRVPSYVRHPRDCRRIAGYRAARHSRNGNRGRRIVIPATRLDSARATGHPGRQAQNEHNQGERMISQTQGKSRHFVHKMVLALKTALRNSPPRTRQVLLSHWRWGAWSLSIRADLVQGLTGWNERRMLSL